ncbi:hypothetical protein [Sphingopyxis chilensis]
MNLLPKFVAAAVLAMVSPANAFAQHVPSTVHSVSMRGAVVHAARGRIVVCVGTADGAHAGQELSVYRVSQSQHGPKGRPAFRRTPVGTVRIDLVLGEHFANASVISGTVELNDIVELRRP